MGGMIYMNVHPKAFTNSFNVDVWVNFNTGFSKIIFKLY